jgi:hypothetical protein
MKIFITLAPGPDVIKLVVAVIYKLSCKARVIVRLGWKSMPGPNALAFHKNSYNMEKSFIASALGVDVIKRYTAVSYGSS